MQSVLDLVTTDNEKDVLWPIDGVCESCWIIPVTDNDKYCEGCLADVLEYLARS